MKKRKKLRFKSATKAGRRLSGTKLTPKEITRGHYVVYQWCDDCLWYSLFEGKCIKVSYTQAAAKAACERHAAERSGK